MDSRDPIYRVRGWGRRDPQRSLRSAYQFLRVRTAKGNKQTVAPRFIVGVYLFTLASLLLGVVGGVFSLLGYQRLTANYPRYLLLAEVGTQHLRMALTLVTKLPSDPLDTHTISQARQEFAAASTSFAQLANDLQPLSWGVGTRFIASGIPIYGTRLYAGFHLSLMAVGISLAGVSGCDLLNALISDSLSGGQTRNDPLNIQGRGLTMHDFSPIDQDLHKMKIALTQVLEQANQLQPTDVAFDPRLSKLFTSFYRYIPALQAALNDLGQLPGVVPGLLGVDKPANYLLEVLDSTELRPGGGFIGNYGILTLSAGRLMTAHITDVALLETPFLRASKVIPYPPAYRWFTLSTHSWSLRDSNLDADFPTAARYGEQNYIRLGGPVPVLGVIAITPALVQHILEITGPIDVTEYHEVVTAQNLVARIQYHELGPAYEGPPTDPSPDGYSSLRKHFTAVLAKHVLARVRQLSPSTFPKLAQLLSNSLRSKDIQIYFNSSAAENLLHLSHLDAAIQPSDKDSLFVVDANLGATNANNFMVNTVRDEADLDGEGTAVHHTTLTYAWIIPGQRYGWPTYRDYIRIYAPPGSTLDMQTGLGGVGTLSGACGACINSFASSQAFGHRVWAGNFTLLYGQTHLITLVWHVPHAATKDSSGWHYQYLVQRQAGTQWTLHLLITLPSCALITGVGTRFIASGNKTAALTQSLNEDMSVGVDYNCTRTGTQTS